MSPATNRLPTYEIRDKRLTSQDQAYNDSYTDPNNYPMTGRGEKETTLTTQNPTTNVSTSTKKSTNNISYANVSTNRLLHSTEQQNVLLKDVSLTM